MARCTAIAAFALCLAFLVGCEASPPAADPSRSPVICRARITPASPAHVEIPSTRLEMNGMDCLLWNPQLDRTQAFYGIVHANDDEAIVPLDVSDGSYATITEYLAQNGKPWSGSFKDRIGWIAVCRNGEET